MSKSIVLMLAFSSLILACKSHTDLVSSEILSSQTEISILVDLKKNEKIDIVPMPARFDLQSGQWQMTFKAFLYKPLESSGLQAAFNYLLKKFLDMPEDEPDTFGILRQRTNRFLVKNLEGRQVQLLIDGQRQGSTLSDESGEATLKFALSPESLPSFPDNQVTWIKFPLKSKGTAEPNQFGDILFQMVPVNGVSVISDIDDTIKETGVPHRLDLLRNTFLRPFRAVRGMPEYYQRLDKDCRPAFHYLSGSPYQLMEPLKQFMNEADLPNGSFYLKQADIRNSTFFNFFKNQIEFKTAYLEEIFKEYSRHSFILVGDSGESDPEIYAGIYRRYPQNIQKILIRLVSDGNIDSVEGLKEAFKEVPDDKWAALDPSKADSLPTCI